jgi:hypothetical protein
MEPRRSAAVKDIRNRRSGTGQTAVPVSVRIADPAPHFGSVANTEEVEGNTASVLVAMKSRTEFGSSLPLKGLERGGNCESSRVRFYAAGIS